MNWRDFVTVNPYHYVEHHGIVDTVKAALDAEDPRSALETLIGEQLELHQRAKEGSLAEQEANETLLLACGAWLTLDTTVEGP